MKDFGTKLWSVAVGVEVEVEGRRLPDFVKAAGSGCLVVGLEVELRRKEVVSVESGRC